MSISQDQCFIAAASMFSMVTFFQDVQKKTKNTTQLTHHKGHLCKAELVGFFRPFEQQTNAQVMLGFFI